LGEVDVVVIGAGAAGLAAGRRLQELRREVLVLDARDRIGGRAWTLETPQGIPLDMGCEWLHSADRNPLTNIARVMGFTVDETLPNWRSVSDAGRDAYDAFVEAIAKEAVSGDPDRSASSLLPADGRWHGRIAAISSYANGAEPDLISIQDNARYADSGINWRVVEGYGRMIAAYGGAVPVKLGVRVTAVDHSGPDIRIETDQGTIAARAVIVATPTPSLAREEIRFRPALPQKVAAAAGLPLGLADKLYLAIKGDLQNVPRDHHVKGAEDLAATGNYQLRPHGRPVIEGFFGGRTARRLEEEGEAAMVQFALDELAGLFGSDFRRRLRPIARTAWEADPFARGSYSHALPGHAGDRAVLAEPVDGRIFFAGEACSPDYFSTAHGAFLTGIAAAEEVAAAL